MWFEQQILQKELLEEPSSLLCQLEAKSNNYCCGAYIYNLRSIERQSMYQDLVFERTQRKYGDICIKLERLDQDWNKLLLSMIMRYIGDSYNKGRYEEIAQRLPTFAVQQERISLRSIETLLIACSGLLDILPRDEFCDLVRREAQYMRHKYQIEPLDHTAWDRRAFVSTKHPLARLLLLARLLYEHKMLFNKVLECRSRKDVINIFNVDYSSDWSRYLGRKQSSHLGFDKCDVLGINVVVPIQSAYGMYTANDELCYAANDLIEALPAEDNGIISRWRKEGLTPTLAYETQALLQLHLEYCKPKKCRDCVVYKHINSPASLLKEMPNLFDTL